MAKKLLFFFTVAMLLRLILSFGSWHPDLNNHVDWGIRFFEYGPLAFYAPDSNVWGYTWPNQPPGAMLLFAGIYQLFLFIFGSLMKLNILIPAFPSGVIFFLESTLHQALLKLPSILADLGIAFLIYKLVSQLKNKKVAKLAAILFLFNPVIWYNSSIWGQTDSIINFLFLLSVYLLIKDKLLFSVLALALCLYIKLSLAIFIPIYLIFLIKKKFSVSGIVISIVVALALIGIITIMFSYPKEPFGWLLTIYREKVLVQQMHVITANAFNFWDALTGIYEQPNSLMLGPLTYRAWGNVLFSLVYFPTLFLLWKKPTTKNLICVLALAGFSSFMLLTNMHERYLYPLFPYLTILVALHRKLKWPFVAISLINLLNLYHLWYTPRIEAIVTIMSFSDRLVPRLLGIAMTLLYIHFYFYIIKLWQNGGSR